MPLIKREKIFFLVDKMMEKFDIIGPVLNDGKYVFQKVSSGREISLDYDTSILPPKKIFFPQEEILITFKKGEESGTKDCTLVSDCLYDSDKFRWGPDNFYYTVWDMVSFYKTPFPKFMHYYPKGMDTLYKIKNTFRTNTGKKYGPQFIEIGIAIGEELFDVINNEFTHLL